jgi:preprotein translocase subunit SecY
MALYAAGIIFFCFFYTAVVFNPGGDRRQSEAPWRLHPRHPPGQEHRAYLDHVLTRITVIGAAYLAASVWCRNISSPGGIPFQLGGTSLLIVVNVTIDTVTQIQSHMLAHQYGDLIKKAKLKGGVARR